MKPPLLAVDGDSFAHRAYHALPKSIRFNSVVGFTNMLVRLWEMEQPRAVLVGWDSLDTPTYRHEAFPAYQSGRVFDKSLLEQLDMRRNSSRRSGSSRRRRLATRRTTSSPPRSPPRRRAAGPASSRPATVTRTSSRATER